MAVTLVGTPQRVRHHRAVLNEVLTGPPATAAGNCKAPSLLPSDEGIFPGTGLRLLPSLLFMTKRPLNAAAFFSGRIPARRL